MVMKLHDHPTASSHHADAKSGGESADYHVAADQAEARTRAASRAESVAHMHSVGNSDRSDAARNKAQVGKAHQAAADAHKEAAFQAESPHMKARHEYAAKEHQAKADEYKRDESGKFDFK